jgi:hypothetical protein
VRDSSFILSASSLAPDLQIISCRGIPITSPFIFDSPFAPPGLPTSCKRVGDGLAQQTPAALDVAYNQPLNVDRLQPTAIAPAFPNGGSISAPLLHQGHDDNPPETLTRPVFHLLTHYPLALNVRLRLGFPRASFCPLCVQLSRGPPPLSSGNNAAVNATNPAADSLGPSGRSSRISGRGCQRRRAHPPFVVPFMP